MPTISFVLSLLTAVWVLVSLISLIHKPSRQTESKQFESATGNLSRKLLPATVIAFITLGALTAFSDIGTQKITYPAVSYDSQSTDNNLENAGLLGALDKTVTELNIRFRIKAPPDSTSDNAHRTAVTSDGTRMELGQLVGSGLSLFLSGRKNMFDKVYEPVELDRWYFVAIKKTLHKLEVRIDKEPSIYTKQPGAIIYNLARRDNTPIKAWNIAAGTGYGRKINFSGKIEDFTLECAYSPQSTATLSWLDLGKTLNILTLIALVTAMLAKKLEYLNGEAKRLFLSDLSLGIPILLVVFPLLDLTATYYVDWHNHVWTIGYTGEFFRSNHAFPLTVNLSEYALSPQPIFYGALFYPLIGMMSSVTGPALALRLVIITLFLLQYYACNRLIYRLSGNELISHAVSVLVTWSIYPLTNLYNRAALTEFVATTLAFVALCIFLLLILDREQFQGMTKLRCLAYFCISMVLCVGTHPITAMLFMLSIVFVSMIFLPFLLEFLKHNKVYCIVLAVISLILIFPVAYPVLLNHDLHIVKATKVRWFSNGIDSWLHRFSPLLSSIDERIARQGIAHVSTPYLDTQINMCLLFLGILLLKFASIKKEHKYAKHMGFAVILSLAYLFIASLLSLSENVYQYLPSILSAVQFCYRMVTYQNIAIFLILVLLLVFCRIRTNGTPHFFVCLTIIMTLSFSSVLIKLEHLNAVKNILINTGAEQYETFPATYYSKADYTSCSIPEITGPFENDVNFPVSKRPFGRVEQASVNVTKAGWFRSNIARFKWNQIYVDGKQLDTKDIRAWGNYLVLHLDAGTHTLKAVCTPPGIYMHARNFSVLALLTLIVIMLIDVLIGSLHGLLHFRTNSNY